MKSLSVGRVPHGLLFITLLAIGSGLGQPTPAAVVLSQSASNQTCSSSAARKLSRPLVWIAAINWSTSGNSPPMGCIVHFRGVAGGTTSKKPPFP